jgi:hypothetical protein
MESILNQTGAFPAVAILAALILQSVAPAEAPRRHDRLSANPAVVRLGPGTTGAEIQPALDSLPGTGGEVVLPSGSFEINRPIVLRRDGQTLRGAGPATILRLADDANCPVIIMGEPVDNPREAVSHLRVIGLKIDGNRGHQRSELWRTAGEGSDIRNNGINVQDVRDSAVEDVTCAHCRSGGLVTTRGVRRLEVRNLEAFDNEFDGLACYSTADCRFENLYLHDNGCAGISLDLAFDNNCIVNARLTANDLGIFMRASCDNRFQAISIRRSRHFGVFIAQADVETPQGWRLVPHSECTGNLFMDLQAAGCGGAAFHVNDPACTNNRATGFPSAAALNAGSPPDGRATF